LLDPPDRDISICHEPITGPVFGSGFVSKLGCPSFGIG
jgi:hypothetical protein